MKDPADQRLQTLTSPGEPASQLPQRPVPQLVLLIEGERPLARPVVLPMGDCRLLELGRGETRSTEGTDARRWLLADRWMSASHARLTATRGKLVLEDQGSKNGTLVNGVALPRHLLADGDLIEVGHSLLRFRDRLPPCMVHAPSSEPGFSTFSPEFARGLSGAVAIATSNVPLLIQGETGTGKELIARGVHALARASGAFVAVNCGALPAALLEAELFGYRRGAFSGASQDHPGLFRAAEQGTLFLDEIGDLAPAGQAALLRALQEHEVLPIGEVKPIKVAFRVVAATHMNLAERVAEGRFRQDLYARLAGHVLELPPLRERREDLGLLIGTLLARLAPGRATPVRLAAEVGRALHTHDWPLNVRELERCLEAALALAGEATVRLEHLPDTLRGLAEPGVSRPAPRPAPPRPRPLTREDLERKVELARLLGEHQGNISAVALAMGKERVQIRRWIKRYGL